MSKYAKWLDSKDLNEGLTKINSTKDINVSGIQLSSDEDSIYIDKSDGHSLVIGAVGSGKTQTIILPLINMSMIANESFVVNDVKAKIYKLCAKELENRGYKVILINFDNPLKGNYYNPFDVVKSIYKENESSAEGIVELIAKNIYEASATAETDMFWANSAMDFFCGIVSYMLSNNMELTFNSVFDFANKLIDSKVCDEFKSKLDNKQNYYGYLSGTINSPKETRNSIISVFNSELSKLVSNTQFKQMLSKTDFDINDIDNKTAIFMVPNKYNKFSNLQAILINELYEILVNKDNNKKINFILDDFDEIYPISNLASVLNYSRGYNINFTCNIKSVMALKNKYKNQELDLIKLCFKNIIYLYSNDITTLNFISELCGNTQNSKGDIEPLVTPEELKVYNNFEALVIRIRTMPVRTILKPSYQISWGYDQGNEELPEQ